MSKSIFAKLVVMAAAALLFASPARAQWTALSGAPNASTCILLTDGTVLCQNGEESNTFQRLTPDNFGSYANGSWTTSADLNLPSGYGPLYYCSAVLPDSRVVMEGGEYNSGTPNCPSKPGCDVNLGAIFDPTANSGAGAWTSLGPPDGGASPWNHIGDANCVILPNGTLLLQNINGTQIAQLNASTLTYSDLYPWDKADSNSEENWTLLPNGDIFTVDTEDGTNSEVYNYSANAWSSAGSTVVVLTNTGGFPGIVPEPGVQPLQPDGIVFAIGASGLTTVYNSATGVWGPQGPTLPTISGNQLLAADTPAAILPDGHVLFAASPFFASPTYFFEYDGTSLSPSGGTQTSSSGSHASYQTRMLVLPSGDVLVTDGSNDVELYNNGGGPQDAWRPTITAAPVVVSPGNTYTISGTQFNGLTQGAFYGDDASLATNYPIVRIVNQASGHVFYARTHNHSSMGVATGSAIVTTQFDAPAAMESGESNLFVVANGIPSEPFVINGPALTLPGPLSLNTCSGTTATATLNACNTGAETLDINSIMSSSAQISVSTPSSGYPVSISPDACFPFQVSFQPTSPGTTNATLTINSNDPNHPTETVAVTGTAPAPSINLTVANGGNFGNVCPGGASSLNLNVTNQSSCNLVINSITTSAGFLPPSVKLPLTLTADATVPLPVSFDPSTSQACSTTPITGTVTINSNDPTQPFGTTVPLSGTVPCPHIATTIPNNGNFGTLCSGQVSDLNLEVLNTGQCNLNISSISSSSAQFALPTSPLVLSADANVDLPVAFQPAKYGSPGYVTCSNTVPETSNITIVSNDPSNPVYVVPVQGIEGCPTLVLGPLNLTGVNDYPPTVSDPTGTLGCYTDKQITVSNTGICPLYVVNAATVNGLDGKGLPLPASPLEYNVVNTPLPITVKPGGKPAPVTVRFKPEILTDQNPFAPDQQTGTLNITSNDPVAGDNTAALCGEPVYGSGARILLVDTLDNPISEVTELILTTTNITPPFNETLKPAPLQPPANVCGNTINYHLDNETLKPTGTNPNAYYRVLVKDNPHYYPPVDFRLTQCQFQQIVIVRQY